MGAGLIETVLGVLRLALLFLVTLFLPLLIQLSLLLFFGWAFRQLVERAAPLARELLDMLGTPVHEFSHALAALITLSGVAALKPIIDELGYAFVAPRRAGRLRSSLISLAPLLGGMAVLWLTARYIIPDFGTPEVPLPQLNLVGAASLNRLFEESLGYLGRFLEAVYRGLPDLQWGQWRTYVGLYIALSVCIGIAPSVPDLRIFLRSLPVAILAFLGLFTVFYLTGDVESRLVALQQGLIPHLLRFSTVAACAFMLTVLGVILFLPLRLWQRWRGAPATSSE